MNDLNVIDRFMDSFVRYIDSGFGLLGPDVGFLTTILIGIDITLAGLFWALGGEDDVIGKFLRKILYVGVFALILNSFATLTGIIFRSFAGLGLTAGGGTITAGDLLRPGRLAGTGFEAARPLLDQAGELVGPVAFFTNFVEIAVLMIAWVVVIVAFFILAVQMFVTILEFKLTSLAGFVLVPFALWNRTAFLAERVLGNVISSGIKVMVLAVIVGIGSNYFSEFTGSLQGQEPDLDQALSLMLASLALLGLGIFGPSIASGLVSGAPQLGAGAAAGTVIGAGAVVGLGGAAAIAGARGAAGAGLGAIRAGTAMGAAASSAAQLGRETGGSSLGGIAAAAKGAMAQRVNGALGLGAAAERGRDSARSAMTGKPASASSSSGGTPGQAAGGSAEAPAWAQRLRTEQTSRHRRQAAVHVLGSGPSSGAGATPDIKERD
ncbi:MAG TPA: P-type conjugative transfer protein TrbL [Allosphingosinicella sp.]|nr:P-type conjugative transfer protein TrbL [Allosphingosinicella sp.]